MLAYVCAAAIFVTGTLGLFGQSKDPISGIFLLPLGLPWNLTSQFFAESLDQWIVIFAPLINLLILWQSVKLTKKKTVDDL